MRRFYASCVIFVTLVTISCFVYFELTNQTISINETIDEAVILWELERYDEVLLKVEEINSKWEQYKKSMDITINVNDLADITARVAKLKPLLIYQSDEFFSECSSIKFSLEHIQKHHSLTFDAIF